ncbi:hypothetical protein FOZ61_002858 [Perkinsus olseni]|uniref:C3H1-type domain-containing protein n=1 Tax=Perkinsus olseni TaxID=32597 RepID=A0A7J6LS22_PEROL|nr:hypothetical protein FOZ61_002858 [Perkinsus olseni]KAF4667606.1 hypothetical protein FOL46_002424 [Perkinsus olseni]
MCRACARSQQLRLHLDRDAPTTDAAAASKSRRPSVASDCSSVVPSTKSSPTDRSTVTSTPCSAGPSSPPSTTTRPLCAYFKNDRCRMGNACRFAHSLKEHKNPRLILMRRFPQYRQQSPVQMAPYVAQPPVMPNQCYGYVAPPPAVQQPQAEAAVFPLASPGGPMTVPAPPPQMYYYYQPTGQGAAAPVYYAPMMVQQSPEPSAAAAPVMENQ